jgi:hypothetical protein
MIRVIFSPPAAAPPPVLPLSLPAGAELPPPPHAASESAITLATPSARSLFANFFISYPPFLIQVDSCFLMREPPQINSRVISQSNLTISYLIDYTPLSALGKTENDYHKKLSAFV